MNTLFHLLRHADHAHVGRILTGRLPGVALTKAGRQKAAGLARALASARIEAIFSSPRQRAMETAGIIAAPHWLDVQVSEHLDEIDFGRWSGQSFKALEHDLDWVRWNQARDTARTPAGDSMANVAVRVTGFLEGLHERFPGGSVALVTHSDVIKACICHYRHLPFQEIHGFEIAPASLTTLSFGPGGATILALNEHRLEPEEAVR